MAQNQVLNRCHINFNENSCPCHMENCQCLADNISEPKTPSKIIRLSSKAVKNELNRFKVTTIGRQTTDHIIAKLLDKQTRVIHIRLAYGTPDEHEQLMLKINNAIENRNIFNKNINNHFPTPIAIAIEIRGYVRIGRLRNNLNCIRLKKNDEIALTSNELYRYSSVKEIIYLSQFDDYLDVLKIGDYIFVNKSTVQLQIIKIVKSFKLVYCKILMNGEIKSYARITLPYYITNDSTYTNDELEDCSFAIRHKADFIIIPSVLNGKYFQKIQTIFKNNKHQYHQEKPLIFANIDKYILLNFDEEHLNEIISYADGIWFEKYSKSMHDNMTHAISIAVEQLKPVICITHKSLCKICGGKNRRRHYEQITVTTKDQNERFEKLCKAMIKIQTTPSGTNCVALTTFLLEAKLLIAITKTGHIPIFLTNAVNVSCQIIVVTKHINVAKKLTIWKNLMPIIYHRNDTNFINDEYEMQLKFGLDYSKSLGLVKIGDAVGYCFDNQYHRLGSDVEQPTVFRVIYVNS